MHSMTRYYVTETRHFLLRALRLVRREIISCMLLLPIVVLVIMCAPSLIFWMTSHIRRSSIGSSGMRHIAYPYVSRFQRKLVHMHNPPPSELFNAKNTSNYDHEPPPWKSCDSSYTGEIRTILTQPASSFGQNIVSRYCEYLAIPAVTDIKQIASKAHSRISLVEPKDTFSVGEEIKVSIKLFDGFGNALTSGGDILRIWVTERDTGSNVAGYVIDNMDGTYTGSVKACWVGNPTVIVSVAQTKQQISVYLNYLKKYGSFRHSNATFINRAIPGNESTQCAPYYEGVNERYGGFCNFTKDNFNISFYCGKPKHFACSDWKLFGWDGTLYLDTITQLLLSEHKHIRYGNISVKTIQGPMGATVLKTPTVSCSKLPPEDTWKSQTPTGFMYKDKWYSLLCKNTLSITVESYRKCLKDRPVMFIGDSTTRLWFVQITILLGLKVTTGKLEDIQFRDPGNRPWQKYAHSEDNANGIDVSWMPHEHPFHGTPGSTRDDITSVAFRLDHVGANSSAIINIHWYLHMVRCCDHEVIRRHVRNAKDAVVRLLDRSPDVHIGIKGPHAVTFPRELMPNDYIRRYLEQVLFEEFKDLQNKVTYLEEWDMTVGNENVELHPPNSVNKINVQNYMSFACNQANE